MGGGGYSNIQYNSTYSKTSFPKDDIINNNESYCQKLDLKLTDEDRSLTIKYWLLKLHKTPTGARFIIVFKNFSTKPLLAVICKIFKMLFKHLENFHDKNRF